ncbi:MFS transporter, ACS family, pantothenate transporter [Entomortierella parvispora]|uniref:MFS transporter, ACS family, pantothenate transporter n=1 Tax=Entomortierella parvispora TaxID=205924 RepID=A0A9P3HF42_9FUNG|nr:MFS transporter, ACS family, pantothenate transporter [Entomortierella parvispora]
MSGSPQHDKEKSHDIVADDVVLPEDPTELEKIRRSLMLKMDLRLVPWVSILYMFSSLDRGNIGNARLAGLEKGTHISDSQYFNVLSMFYAGYTISQVPSNLMLKRVLPSRWISFTMVMWGVCAASMAATTNYSGLLACRFFMGIFEAGIGPGAPLLLSWWYLRDELAWRVALFIGSSTVAGAFGGLISYGIMKNMADNPHFQPWQIIFLIEGCLTIFFGLLTVIVLPNMPEQASTRLLTPEEKQLAIERYRSEFNHDDNVFDMSQLVAAFKDTKNWACVLLYIGMNICLSSYTAFLPTIISEFGVTPLNAQLLSVPPYICAAVSVFAQCRLSDRMRNRGMFIAGSGLIAALGYILLISNGLMGVNYVGAFLVACGIYPIIPLTLAWVSNNNIGHTKRAVGLAMLNMFAQALAMAGGQIYPTNTAPRFVMGHAICLAFILFTALVAALLSYYISRINAKRDEQYGPPQQMTRQMMVDAAKDGLYDMHPSFRYYP